MTEESNNVEAEVSASAEMISLTSFYGVKAGMTRIFDEAGNHIPVTVVKLIPNFISQVKTTDKDGYEAYQIAYGQKKEKHIIKPKKGQLEKAGLDNTFNNFAELRMSGVDSAALGKEVSVSEFVDDAYVDVTGISKGKGFQGVMKRHNFAGGPAAHGSHFHRHGGSIGNRATPGRVFKLKKMPGQMGDKQKTIQNIKVVETNLEKGYMLIRGSVPGAKNGFVRVSKAIKK